MCLEGIGNTRNRLGFFLYMQFSTHIVRIKIA